MMKFSWLKFDSLFLYEVLKVSEIAEVKKRQIDYAYNEEDKDLLVGLMNEVCTYPDRKFVIH